MKILVNKAPIFVSGLLVLICFLRFKSSNDHTKPLKSIITAEVSNKARALPLYGFDGNNTGGPAYSNDAFRDSVASLHLRMIRYPGGTIANWWDWQNGWYEKTTVQNGMQNPNTRQIAIYSPSGLKELKLLVDQTHCEVLFVLNVISRDVDDQIAMLHRAQELGMKVKWVELGNELNLKQSVGRKKFNSPLDYAKNCENWISKLKAEFPDIKVAIVGGNFQYSGDVAGWNDVMLENSRNSDAIIAHLYPIPGDFIDDTGVNFEKFYNDCENQISGQGFDVLKNKEIWVTEYNIQWEVKANRFMPSMATDEQVLENKKNAFEWCQALMTLVMTSMFTEMSPNTKLIINHNVSNTPTFAAIDTRKKSVFHKMPNGIGMAEWLKASENMNSMDKIKFRDGHRQVKDFDVFGWRFFNSTNDSYGYLFVNLTDQPLKVNVSSLPKSNAEFKSIYAEKNALITDGSNINHVIDKADNNVITLPPYSITTSRG